MRVLITFTVAALLSACATKSYHIAAPLPQGKAKELSCRELALELAEVDAIAVQIKEEAEVDARSVGAFLMDFGIGNSIAKGNAEEALAVRRASITSAMAEKNCSSAPESESVEATSDSSTQSPSVETTEN